MSKKAIVIAVGLTILLLFVLAGFVTPSIGRSIYRGPDASIFRTASAVGR